MLKHGIQVKKIREKFREDARRLAQGGIVERESPAMRALAENFVKGGLNEKIRQC